MPRRRRPARAAAAPAGSGAGALREAAALFQLTVEARRPHYFAVCGKIEVFVDERNREPVNARAQEKSVVKKT